MKNSLIILLFFLNLSVFGQSEKIKASKIDSFLLQNNELIGIDNLQNRYYIDANVLYKKNTETTFQYQNVSLGKITKVDLLNPLKILLFYENFNTAILVDNQLNEIQKIDFSAIETPIIAGAIGTSSQNKLWVYNTINQQLGLFDLGTKSFKTLGVQLQQSFISYHSNFNTFEWIDAKNQLFSCTIFGKISLITTLNPFDFIQVMDSNRILYSKNGIVHFEDLKSKKLFEIEIVEKSFEKFFYDGQILTIFTNKEIITYKIKIP